MPLLFGIIAYEIRAGSGRNVHCGSCGGGATPQQLEEGVVGRVTNLDAGHHGRNMREIKLYGVARNKSIQMT